MNAPANPVDVATVRRLCTHDGCPVRMTRIVQGEDMPMKQSDWPVLALVEDPPQQVYAWQQLYRRQA